MNSSIRNRARTCFDQDGNRSRERESETCGAKPCCDKWSTWTDCTVTCGNGERQRQRFCDKDTETDIDICENDKCVDEEWGDWVCPKCSKTCGGGFQLCKRTCIGGQQGDPGCPGPDHKPQTCNSQKCEGKKISARSLKILFKITR